MLPLPQKLSALPQFEPLLGLCDAVLVTSAELARHWRLSVAHVHHMRRVKTGPAWIKLPTGRQGGAVRYRLSEVMAWELHGGRGAVTPERLAVAVASCPGVSAPILSAINSHVQKVLFPK